MKTNYNGKSESITDILKTFQEFYFYLNEGMPPKKRLWRMAKKEFKSVKRNPQKYVA